MSYREQEQEEDPQSREMRKRALALAQDLHRAITDSARKHGASYAEILSAIAYLSNELISFTARLQGRKPEGLRAWFVASILKYGGRHDGV